MNYRLPLLGGVLLAQCILIAGIYLSGESRSSERSLLSFTPEAVSVISISDGEGPVVEMQRKDGVWLAADGVPVDAAKINAVLEKLAGIASSWPVATSTGSQVRFEVGEDNYQRRVTLNSQNETLIDLYLGTSPGFRRVHARNAGADAIFSIDFAAHEVPVNADHWLDKSLLQPAELSRVELSGSWALTRADSSWLLDGYPSRNLPSEPSEEAANPEARASLIERLGNIQVTGYFHADEVADEVMLEDERVLLIEDSRGSLRMVFRHRLVPDEYVVSSDRVDGAFLVPSHVAEQILLDSP